MEIMKKFTPSFFILIVLLGSLLAGCAGGTTIPTSWPGLALDLKKDVVFVASGPHVYAVNLTNGAEKWRFPVAVDKAKSFYSNPVVTSDGQVIVGGYDNVLYSLNPDTGAVNWPFSEAKGRYISGPAIAADAILAASADQNLYALDLSGKLLWKFPTGYALWGAPASDASTVYLPGMDHYIYAISLDKGALVWGGKEKLGGSIVGTPALSDQGVLYVGTFGSEMLALNARDGNVLWRTPTKSWVWSGVLLQGNVIYFGDLSGTFTALNTADGSVLWSIQPDTAPKRSIVGLPVIVQNTLYFTSESGVLYAVDPANGNPRWSKSLGGKLYAGPLAAGDKILVALFDAQSLLIELDLNGNQIWSYMPAK
jgi:outer membrane protein assembly factor BamB